MKITGQGPVNWKRAVDAYNNSNKDKNKVPLKKDSFQISSDIRFLEKIKDELKAQVQNDVGLRNDRIESIRSRIENGTYKVSMADVADAIMKELGL
ncbi:MAG: negative regulator of flagellin synthesis FlgM [Clostridia bacterium]|nr:negative regulator of flagellin synthesis FlgM [Clostridia bacterium]